LVQLFSEDPKKTGPMNTTTSKIDRAIEQYRKVHNGDNPLYFIMSAEEADELAKILRKEAGADDKVIFTSYQDIKIIRNNLLERGEYFLGNELPETGS
jgi:hypothetical protein